MKRILLLVVVLLSFVQVQAQYNTMEPRDDYREAFSISGQSITWSRTVVLDIDQQKLVSEAVTRISVTTVVDNMIIGNIEGVSFGANAGFSTARLPWDGASIKANVVYTLNETGYTVTVSQIYYLHEQISRSYLPIYGTIYKSNGVIRSRGDGDLRYFDNAFCDLLLIE
jgi:hypothetical protein